MWRPTRQRPDDLRRDQPHAQQSQTRLLTASVCSVAPPEVGGSHQRLARPGQRDEQAQTGIPRLTEVAEGRTQRVEPPSSLGRTHAGLGCLDDHRLQQPTFPTTQEDSESADSSVTVADEQVQQVRGDRRVGHGTSWPVGWKVLEGHAHQPGGATAHTQPVVHRTPTARGGWMTP